MAAPETESDIVEDQCEKETTVDAYEEVIINEVKVYEKRADFRNRHRKPLIETTKWLNRHIPEVNTEVIEQEETERVLFEVRKSIRQGVYKTVPEAFASAKLKRHQVVSSRDLYVDEYGKYYAGRMRGAWLKGDFETVLDLHNEFHDNSLYEDAYKDAVERETDFMTADQVVKFVRSGDCRSAIEGMLKLFEIKEITLPDLLDAGIRENEIVMLERAIKDFLVGRFEENPLIYYSLTVVFAGLGFDLSKNMKNYPLMQATVGDKLAEAASAGVVYLEEAVDVFERMELLDRKEALDTPFVRHPIIDLLAEAAGISPEAYERVRNYVTEKGLIAGAEADRLYEVERAASDFLRRMYQVHPELALLYFNKFVSGDVEVKINDDVLDQLRQYVRQNVILSRLGVNILDMDYFVHTQAKTNVDNANRFLQAHTEHELQVFNDFRQKYQRALEEFMAEFPAIKGFLVAVEDL